jgi:hypothetical protein
MLRRPLALERATGFGPATLGLGSRCSTTELRPRYDRFSAPIVLLRPYFPSLSVISVALMRSSLRAFQVSRLLAP